MVQVVASLPWSIVVAVVIVGPRPRVKVRASARAKLLRELLQQHELTELLLAVHLLCLVRSTVEAAELLRQVVAATAVHALELLVGELLRIHLDCARYIALGRTHCTVLYKACHSRVG